MVEGTTKLRRRSLLKTATSAALGTLGAVYIISARAADTLVVSSYGGEYQEVFTRTVIQPFIKKFGVQISCDQTSGAVPIYAKSVDLEYPTETPFQGRCHRQVLIPPAPLGKGSAPIDRHRRP